MHHVDFEEGEKYICLHNNKVALITQETSDTLIFYKQNIATPQPRM